MALDTGQLNLMTKEQYWPDVVSQVTTDTAFITRLMKKKKMKGNGRSWKWTLLTKVQDGQWYSGYEVLNVSQDDPFKEAELDWRNLNMPVSISGDEIDKNSGTEGFHDLMEEKMKYTVESMKRQFGYGIMQGRGAAYKELAGLYDRGTAANSAIALTPTTGTYAGINRATGEDQDGAGLYTNWWRNQYQDVNGALSLTDMQKMISKCEKHGARPSIIVTSHDMIATYYDKAKGQQRVDHDSVSALGFKSFQYAGIPIVADMYCYEDTDNSDGVMYFLDESDIELRFLNGKFMKRTPWFTPKDQDAKVMHVRNKAIVGWKTPGKHGVMGRITIA